MHVPYNLNVILGNYTVRVSKQTYIYLDTYSTMKNNRKQIITWLGNKATQKITFLPNLIFVRLFSADCENQKS